MGDICKTFIVNYAPVEQGHTIGKAAISVEVFTLGGGYLIDPVIVDITDGENAAQLLARVLTDNGYTYRNTGTLTSAFYISSIAGGRLPIDANIPEVLRSVLESKGVNISELDKEKEELGEFDYTTMSGWMYCVNGNFPNVGFSDYNLADGDVMRVQFTLAYGADISGASMIGYSYEDDYYKVADKDELTRLIAEKKINNVPNEVIKVATKFDSSQADVDGAVNILKAGKVYEDIKNHWASSAISWAAEKEIVKGISENSFATDRAITREQLALVLYRYSEQYGYSTDLKSDLNSFTDKEKISDWAEEAMKWAIGSKIITGRNNNTVDPSGTVTRAEIAVMLERYTTGNFIYFREE